MRRVNTIDETLVKIPLIERSTVDALTGVHQNGLDIRGYTDVVTDLSGEAEHDSSLVCDEDGNRWADPESAKYWERALQIHHTFNCAKSEGRLPEGWSALEIPDTDFDGLTDYFESIINVTK